MGEKIDGMPLETILSWHESLDKEEAIGKWREKFQNKYGTVNIKEISKKFEDSSKSKPDIIS